jgi:hypothetical protein
MKKFLVMRDIGSTTCPWLDKRIHEGDIVYEYTGFTYGLVSDEGIAVTYEPGVTPFFELPTQHLKEIS